MPKAVAHPVDAKLIRRSIERIVRAAKAAGIQLKRTFNRVATWALKDYLRLMHGKKVRKAHKPYEFGSKANIILSEQKGLSKHLKRALRRRQAIEPWIGHMKQDGKLGRCYLKGVIGDQIHATLVAVAHNFRTILRKLRLFCVKILGWIGGVYVSESEKIGLLEQAV